MIEKDKKVKIAYTLTVAGEVIDSSDTRGLLEYRHGHGELISGLERAMEGMNPGDKKRIHVGPEDAYGTVDPQAIIEIPKDRLDAEGLEVGMRLKATTPEGGVLQGVVREIHEETVIVDFNHPLAGKELCFDIEIVEIN